MKVKTLYVITTILIFFSLAACGKKGPLNPPSKKKTIAPHTNQQKK